MLVEFNKGFSALSASIISSNHGENVFFIWISWDWLHNTNYLYAIISSYSHCKIKNIDQNCSSLCITVYHLRLYRPDPISKGVIRSCTCITQGPGCTKAKYETVWSDGLESTFQNSVRPRNRSLFRVIYFAVINFGLYMRNLWLVTLGQLFHSGYLFRLDTG